ncbi:MAG: FecR domain-containing protein [Sphingomonas sp.]|nr:FecR domain-containing protein [Sphingomonas sp.]
MRKAILGLAPLLMAISGAAAAQAPEWRVTEVSGDVRITQGGQSRVATRGALLSSGSTIATAANGRAVIARGQEYIVVSPASRLRLPEAAEQRGGIVQMLTDWGTALFRIERRATPHFGVQTPYLAAVVKGTVFTVTIGEAGGSVQVTEGVVEVSTIDGGAAELIRPGMIVSVSASDLMQLNIEGETSRSIRSDGAGAVTVPAPQPAAYVGPAASTIEIVAPVSEDVVLLAEATGGLIDGRIGIELALADIADQSRLVVNPPAPAPADDDVAGTPPDDDAGTPPDDDAGTPPDDDAGTPPDDDAGTPPDDDAGTPPDDDAGTPPDDDAGTPPDDDVGTPPDDDAGTPPDDDAGTPPDDDAGTPPDDDDGGIGICLPGDLVCIGIGEDAGGDDSDVGVCLPGDLLCLDINLPGLGGSNDEEESNPNPPLCLPLLCRR